MYHCYTFFIIDIYTTEFQQRRLSYAHILLTLDDKHKLVTPDDIDDIICTEIPDPNNEPEAYNTIKRCKIHDPCGYLNSRCVCLKDEKCTKYCPKGFNPSTMVNTY